MGVVEGHLFYFFRNYVLPRSRGDENSLWGGIGVERGVDVDDISFVEVDGKVLLLILSKNIIYVNLKVPELFQNNYHAHFLL